MENLYLSQTNETPEVDFRCAEHTLSVRGESYPENAMAFYAPIRSALSNYLDQLAPGQLFRVEFSLTYFNSSSTKLIRALFALMNTAVCDGRKIEVSWLHDPEDDMMLEFGQDLREEFKDLDVRVLACAVA